MTDEDDATRIDPYRPVATDIKYVWFVELTLHTPLATATLTGTKEPEVESMRLWPFFMMWSR